jgi:hypothetical protein
MKRFILLTCYYVQLAMRREENYSINSALEFIRFVITYSVDCVLNLTNDISIRNFLSHLESIHVR